MEDPLSIAMERRPEMHDMCKIVFYGKRVARNGQLSCKVLDNISGQEMKNTTNSWGALQISPKFNTNALEELYRILTILILLKNFKTFYSVQSVYIRVD